jgi:hypothetical protein
MEPKPPKEPDWSLMPHIMALLDRLEDRLCAAPPVDGLRCCGLWLQLYGDGSGCIMSDYRNASVDETPDARAIAAVFAESHEFESFNSLELLHGSLVAHTFACRRGTEPEE